MAIRRDPEERVIALVGQPNCGKSTLFNAVAGFKVDTGNFAGTSVAYAETSLRFEGHAIRLIDLPGTYSISSQDAAEKVARDFLLSGEVDVIVDVLDSSLLSRSLELTLQLIEMGIPMVICLNMMDEARRKGIEIDIGRLEEQTGVKARPVVAVLGTGIGEVFREALALASGEYRPRQPEYDRDVEECIARIVRSYPQALREALPMRERFVVLRLLEMDEDLERRAALVDGAFVGMVRDERRQLAEMHGWPEIGVLGSHRHAVVLDLYERVATHHRGTGMLGARERIDMAMTNPFVGLAAVAGSLLLAFYLAFFLGEAISGLVEAPSSALLAAIGSLPPGIWTALLAGLAEGLVAGAGIVIPYLVPLLVLLAVYEDTGILPRIAFMVDGLLHRVGLHGKSIVPLMLGFGCNVPAVMATRNLENQGDRLVTMLVVPFVTCSARSVIILALAGRYLGAGWVVGLYALGGAVALAVAYAVSRVRRHPPLGLIMEVPPLRRPYPGIIAKKVWLRLREFFVVAWPVIVVSSVALAALSHVGFDGAINRALSPLTSSFLGLPESTGMALFLGVFRKELTLVMLSSSLGGDPGSVLGQGQILALVVFTMLYVPCIATLTAIWKEGGWKACLASAGLNLGVALAVAGIVARVAGALT